jgi:hypothetical protein
MTSRRHSNRGIEALEPRRLFSAGQIDTTFGADGAAWHGMGASPFPNNLIALQTDGKTLVLEEEAQPQGNRMFKR